MLVLVMLIMIQSGVTFTAWNVQEIDGNTEGNILSVELLVIKAKIKLCLLLHVNQAIKNQNGILVWNCQFVHCTLYICGHYFKLSTMDYIPENQTHLWGPHPPTYSIDQSPSETVHALNFAQAYVQYYPSTSGLDVKSMKNCLFYKSFSENKRINYFLLNFFHPRRVVSRGW